MEVLAIAACFMECKALCKRFHNESLSCYLCAQISTQSDSVKPSDLLD
jgi:hypothetical protein